MIKRKNLQPRILYLATLSFRFDGEIKSFPSKQELRESGSTKPAGAAQARLLLPARLGARQPPQAHSGSVHAAALRGESGPIFRRGGRAHRVVVQATLGSPASLWGHGLSLEPCSQPHSCCCPWRHGFCHPFVFGTFCGPGVTPGVRAAGWPPDLELQEALSSTPLPPRSQLSAACGRALLPTPASALCASMSLAFVFVACSPRPAPVAPWLPSLHPGCRAATPSGKASLTFHQPTRSLV